MTKKYIFILICFLLSLTTIFTPNSFAISDAIIAVVDEEIITLKDLKDYINSVYTQLKVEGKHSESQIRQIMQAVELR